MKFSLRSIAIIISAIMLGVFLYQLYWLNGLYETTARQFEENVYDAMDVADQNELFQRFESIKNSGAEEPSIALGVHVEEDSIGKQVYYAQEPETENIIYKSSGDSVEFNPFKENIKTTEKLAAYIKKTLHQSVDIIEGVNINVYDSLLSVELKSRQIIQPHQVFVVKVANDSICYSTSSKNNFKIEDAKKFDFIYDMNGVHAFRLYFKNPNRQVLSQMAGMLSTSAVIFIVLIYIFVYLLNTIRKLQTEEELKTNFTNNMTHELKTPIAVSYAAVDALLIANQPASGERQKKYLNIAKEQMNHLSGLVEQILSMSRKNNNRIEMKLERINLEDIISGLTEKLSLLSGKKIEVETQLDSPIVVADKLHLANILNNLMENGMKYSGDSVRLVVSSWKDENMLVVSVEDNGIGMEQKYLEKLFDKFYRIPTGNRYNVKGFGLGLFYVKEMTEKHGGTVEVKSQLGKGSVFTIKIPQ